MRRFDPWFFLAFLVILSSSALVIVCISLFV